MQLKNEDLERAREIKDFLAKHYQEHYDYEYLVQKFGMNKLKLKVAFKAVSHYNVHEFITKVRVEHAKELLENSDRTIAFIAAKVGLDKSNLNLQFKKCTGKTPSQWRKDPSPGFKLYYHSTEK